MTDGGYNGWTNRETWALMLYINNDQGWRESVYELISACVSDGLRVWEVEDRFRADTETLLVRAEYVDHFGDEWPDALADAASDIGSLYRIDWRECVGSLLVDFDYGSCDECDELYELASREGRCGDCGNCADHCDHVTDEEEV